jgi:predicted nucleic acid-binding protein
VESSAILAAILENDRAARRALEAEGRRMISALAIAECHRAIVRARSAGRITDAQERDAVLDVEEFSRGCTIVDVLYPVLDRAGRPFPVEPVRTLDAIHLATAELLGEAPQLVTVVSRDDRVRANARVMGFGVA